MGRRVQEGIAMQARRGRVAPMVAVGVVVLPTKAPMAKLEPCPAYSDAHESHQVC